MGGYGLEGVIGSGGDGSEKAVTESCLRRCWRGVESRERSVGVLRKLEAMKDK